MNLIHGDARKGCVTHLFGVWRAMLARCTNRNSRYYYRYGGRGISVCEDWKAYASFKVWAEGNGYREGLTLDRIDNDSGYAPNNCRFVDRKAQARNRSSSRFITHNGTRATLAEWAERSGMSTAKLWARLNKLGWPFDRAIDNQAGVV